MLTDHCIVGLGNPGLKYFNTRHNIGFHIIDKLAEFFNIQKFSKQELFYASQAEYNGLNIVIAKPVTYMNSSGKAVKQISEMLELAPEKFLIIYDDANLDFGTIRLRPSGSDGGQNGIASVIYEMETEEIPRLRIGINNGPEIEKLKTDDGTDLAEFVLSEFTPEEKKDIDKIINTAKDAALFYIEEGIEAAMNKFNRNVLE